jgi:hypothetical protein
MCLMCNLYDYEMTPEIMASLIEHYRLIGKEWAEAMRMQNAPKEVYPNRSGPVVVLEGDERVVRTDMLWGFPPFKGPVLTNFRNVGLKMWRDWLDGEHRCVVPAMYFAEPDRNTSKPVVWRWFGRRDGLAAVDRRSRDQEGAERRRPPALFDHDDGRERRRAAGARKGDAGHADDARRRRPLAERQPRGGARAAEAGGG